MQNPFTSLVNRLISPLVERRVRFMLTDRDGFYDQQTGIDQRDRFNYDRTEVLREALTAWRSNPLARRLVSITTQYVVGGGITVTTQHKPTSDFLKTWWNHALNQCPARVYEWCDELIRSGEIFFLLSTDAAGMTYVRAVPAIHIKEVHTAQNDLQQEQAYVEMDNIVGSWSQSTFEGSSAWTEGRTWPAYDPLDDHPDASGGFATVMLHYAINRPAGAVRGESDLAPLLKWLSRYTGWLEDRVRLNKYRNSFLFVVKAKFASEAERLARQVALNTNPPSPGSIMVTDDAETWEVIKPQLDTFEASADGLSIKKMLCAGAGLPLHFLAEPEQTNKTTAESSSDPAFRHLAQRQEFFHWLLRDLAKAVITRRSVFDRQIQPTAEIEIHGLDLSSKDNVSLSQAASSIVSAFGMLHDKGLIDDGEYLRMAYRFAGETIDTDSLKPGKPQPVRAAPAPAGTAAVGADGVRPGDKPAQPGGQK